MVGGQDVATKNGWNPYRLLAGYSVVGAVARAGRMYTSLRRM